MYYRTPDWHDDSDIVPLYTKTDYVQSCIDERPNKVLYPGRDSKRTDLPNCQTNKLIYKLPYDKTTKLPKEQTTKLPYHRTVKLPNHQTTKPPNFYTTNLPNFHTAEVPDFLTGELPIYQTAKLYSLRLLPCSTEFVQGV